MKRLLLLLFAGTTLSLASCSKDNSNEPDKPVVVTGVTLNTATLSLTEGDTEILTATIVPDNANDKSVTWSSDNPLIASVDGEGKVIALAEGTALITATTTSGAKTDACTVTVIFDVYSAITDSEFLKRVKAQTSWDTNNDAKLSKAEAAVVTSMDVSSEWDYEGTKIASLAGLEYFTGLTELYCAYNDLTTLDLSANKALTSLFCLQNKLISLNVSGNEALTILSCFINELEELDVSTNKALTSLLCSNNRLFSLNVSANKALKMLTCHNNLLLELDVSNNIALTRLICTRNKLTSLDISKNTLLKQFGCSNNLYLKTIWVWDSFDATDPASVFTQGYDNTTDAVFRKL